jgi:hypothetical protein
MTVRYLYYFIECYRLRTLLIQSQRFFTAKIRRTSVLCMHVANSNTDH